MSETEIKNAGESEDTLGLVKTEISEVTITEYRKNQIVRLAECLVGGGMIVAGVKYRKQMPSWLSTSLTVAGAGMFLYNGRNLYKNWNQDGKLIREAIKTKKIEEKKIREDRKKKPDAQAPEQKEEPVRPPQAKSQAEAKPPVENHRQKNSVEAKKAEPQRHNTALNGNGNNKYPSANPVPKPTEKKEVVNGSSNNAIIVDKIKIPQEPIAQEVNIVESAKLKGDTISAVINSEAGKQPAVVESTIIETEKAIPLENGN